MNIFQEAKQILDKDGKVNALGPYGKSKLTGSEVAQYFRKNKVSDSKIKKAVEVALDLGGAMDIARKEIQKFYGDKILKSKEVQSALKFANEETVNEIFGISQDPRYRAKVMKMLDDEGIKYKKDGRNALIILGVAPKDQKKLLDRIHKEFGMSSYNIIDENSDMAINPKTINKSKPMLMKYAKKFGVDLEFGIGGRMPSVLQIKSKSSQAEKGFLDAVGKDKQLMKLIDHVEYDINENYRTAARHGMGTEGKKEARVGLELDYYDSNGNKHMGKIVKKDSKGYTVKDDKTGKMHTFVYHDRIKARKFLQKMGDNLGEGAFSVKLDKPYKRGDEKIYMDIIKKYGGKNLKYSPPKGRDLELDITFDGGDVKKIKSNLPNKGKGSEWISEGSKSFAQQAAIAISKKEKAGKPGYDKEGKSLKKESVMDTYRKMWEDAIVESKDVRKKYRGKEQKSVDNLIMRKGVDKVQQHHDKNPKEFDKMVKNLAMMEDASDIVEVTDKEINAMKQLSKDAEKIKKNFQKIVNMGDKELKDKKYNKEYEDILKMSQSVLSLIGKLQTQKIINKESLEEKLNKQDLKFIDMMYDKKGNLTDVGKAVMNYKPGDNIRKIVQNLNNKK